MPRHVPTDRDAYRRLRWQARWITVGALIPFTLSLVELVRLAGDEDPTVTVKAGWAFFQLGLYAIGAGLVVWWAWRRSFRARPVVLAHDAGPGATTGVPELDAPSRAHTSLTGEVPPPRRW